MTSSTDDSDDKSADPLPLGRVGDNSGDPILVVAGAGTVIFDIAETTLHPQLRYPLALRIGVILYQ
jgi:hypothetical protein